MAFVVGTNLSAQNQDEITGLDELKGTQKDAVMSGGSLVRSTAVSDGTEVDDSGFTPDFQISSSDGDTIVGTAAISNSGPITPSAKRVGDEIRYRYGRRNFTAKLTVPFNETGENPFIQFKNIGDDVTLEFDFASYVVTGTTGIESDRLDVAITAECIREFAAGLGSATESKALLRNLDENLNDRQNSLAAGLLWSGMNRDGYQETTTLNRAQFECEVGRNNRFKNFERLTDQYSGNVTYYGLSGRAGVERYEFLNQNAFALENENRLGFELEGYVGKINASGNAAVRVSASFARAFDADDPMEQCQTPMGGTEMCLTGLLELPEQQDKFFAGVEGRLILSRNSKGEPTMAIAPQVTYDTEDDEFLVEVPLYLQRNKETGLDAGIEFNYSSERDDFAVGFFVGVPLERLF